MIFVWKYLKVRARSRIRSPINGVFVFFFCFFGSICVFWILVFVKKSVYAGETVARWCRSWEDPQACHAISTVESSSKHLIARRRGHTPQPSQNQPTQLTKSRVARQRVVFFVLHIRAIPMLIHRDTSNAPTNAIVKNSQVVRCGLVAGDWNSTQQYYTLWITHVSHLLQDHWRSFRLAWRSSSLQARRDTKRIESNQFIKHRSNGLIATRYVFDTVDDVRSRFCVEDSDIGTVFLDFQGSFGYLWALFTMWTKKWWVNKPKL